MNKSKQEKLFFAICFGILVLMTGCQGKQFTLVSEDVQAVVVIEEKELPYVHRAVDDLVSDILKISGQKIGIVREIKPGIPNLVIGTYGTSGLIGAEFGGLEGKWECYALKTGGNELFIAGSSPRGTMFGIYYFIEEHLGVDPFYWWKDLTPETKETLVFDPVDFFSEEPDFKYRGWFINDEDLMTEFMDGGGPRYIDYPFYFQVVHPDLMERVVESAVRLRFNLLIPASFLDIFNPPEKKLLDISSARGLFLSQHHIESLGVNAFTYFNYWERKTGEKPLFSYYSEKEKVVEVWEESVKRWSKYPDVVWQIGLRGIADRPMWLADPGVPQSDEERAGIISEAMQTQVEILAEHFPGKQLEITTTLWGEGAVFHEMGLLNFPENTTIIFADNSPGWIMQDDFHQTKREPEINYGIYYHHGLIGTGPHLAQAVPPWKTAEIFGLAMDKASDYYCVMNVGNVREFVLGIETSRDMLENMEGYDGEAWLEDWCLKHYGEMGIPAAEAYQAYFNSFVTDDIHGTPLLLDGLSRNRARNNLNHIKAGLENRSSTHGGFDGLQLDAFRKSLAKARPGRQMDPAGWLAKARLQDSLLQLARVLTEEVNAGLTGESKIFLETNLKAHILFMQCLTGWAVETTRAVIAFENQDLESTRTHLEDALDKFALYEEAVGLCSRGKWEQWYRGEKKINVRAVRLANEELLERLKSKTD